MAEDSLNVELNQLTAGARRSKIARLADVFDDVERALRAGVPQQSVLTALKRDGLVLSHASFRVYLLRLRRRRRSGAMGGASCPELRIATDASSEPPLQAPPSPSPAVPSRPVFDPKSIDEARQRTYDWDALRKAGRAR